MAPKKADDSAGGFTPAAINESLPKIAGIARTLATVALDPALGVRGIAISRALNLLATGIEAKGNIDASLEDLDTHVKTMVKEENRAPDLQEWSDLHARSDAAHAAIQGAAIPEAPAS